jgi:hypothetical protein
LIFATRSDRDRTARVGEHEVAWSEYSRLHGMFVVMDVTLACGRIQNGKVV